jgi:hypothetical protein
VSTTQIEALLPAAMERFWEAKGGNEAGVKAVLAGLLDDQGNDVSAEIIEWSARQALEEYARVTSPAKAAALAGEFITSALGGAR